MGKPLHFKGSSFHRVIPDFMCQVCHNCPHSTFTTTFATLRLSYAASESTQVGVARAI
jgi:cyclophilin family peptidyl-prolyl cis-trans isomerase